MTSLDARTPGGEAPARRLALVALLAALACASSALALSGGPEDARTNAPGEDTCNDSGCHSTFELNEGDVTLSLLDATSDLNLAAYVPGQVRLLRLEIRSGESGRRRWGFEMTALAGTEAAGTFVPGIASQVSSSGGRDYLKHSATGVGSGRADGMEWTFTWNAPGSDVGVVTFYACGNAADRSLDPTGDYIECATFEVMPQLEPMDSDDDGLTDDLEAMVGTDPLDPDTDDDFLTDAEEVFDTDTDPLDLDTDDDGLDDFEEDINGLDPLDCDTDDDGLTDGQEWGVEEPIADPDGGGPLEGTDTDAPCADVGGLAFQPPRVPFFMTSPFLQDTDDDGLGDAEDNCAALANADQADLDDDAVGDACDNCVETDNVEQRDFDLDAVGDACDNCRLYANADQQDLDANGRGDTCDFDWGDVAPAGDPNGVVDIGDVVRLLRWAVMLPPDPTDEELRRGNVAPADVVGAAPERATPTLEEPRVIGIGDAVLALRVSVELTEFTEPE